MPSMANKIEHTLETLMFNSRWLLAPFYLGLVVSILILLIKFGQEFYHLVPRVFSGTEKPAGGGRIKYDPGRKFACYLADRRLTKSVYALSS
jgi:hypothetical protein